MRTSRGIVFKQEELFSMSNILLLSLSSFAMSQGLARSTLDLDYRETLQQEGKV